MKKLLNNIGRWFKSLVLPVDQREPRLLTLYKKDSTKSVLSSVICIFAGILIGSIILAVLGLTSSNIPTNQIFKGIGIIFKGPFASLSQSLRLMNFGDMLLEATPILLTGLSVAIAFKTGLFNIGAPGQYLMGAMTSVLVALSIPTGGNPFVGFLVWLLALIMGTLAGAVWGVIPGFFKAFLNVNEVIVCIMTNWIAASVVSWVFAGSKFINYEETKMNFIKVTSTNGVATPKLGLDKLFPGSDIDIGLFIAIAVAIVVYIVINKTTFGYELRSCGSNKHAAKYAGMNEKRNIVLSMVIAGGLSAMGASLLYLNGNRELLWDTYAQLPANGFNGIPVALLASNNPIGVIFASVFLRYIDKAGAGLAQLTSFNEYVSDLIVAIIVYFAGLSKLFRDMLSAKKSVRDLKPQDKKPQTEKGGDK